MRDALFFYAVLLDPPLHLRTVFERKDQPGVGIYRQALDQRVPHAFVEFRNEIPGPPQRIKKLLDPFPADFFLQDLFAVSLVFASRRFILLKPCGILFIVGFRFDQVVRQD